MDSKILALVYWNLTCFLCFSAGKWYIYILEKLLENILILIKNAGKTFVESCNNPDASVDIF